MNSLFQIYSMWGKVCMSRSMLLQTSGCKKWQLVIWVMRGYGRNARDNISYQYPPQEWLLSELGQPWELKWKHYCQHVMQWAHRKSLYLEKNGDIFSLIPSSIQTQNIPETTWQLLWVSSKGPQRPSLA